MVQISAKLVADQSGRILRGRIFTARVPVAAVDTPNTARALDEALSTVMIDIVRWVSSAPLPARQEESRPRNQGVVLGAKHHHHNRLLKKPLVLRLIS